MTNKSIANQSEIIADQFWDIFNAQLMKFM